MRQKVMDMQRLLLERKNKLKVTENSIAKKGSVVDKVEKILHGKERRCKYVEKKKMQKIMFAPVVRLRERIPEDAEAEEEAEKEASEEEAKVEEEKKEAPDKEEQRGEPEKEKQQ